MPDTRILLADGDQIFLELGKTFLRKTGVEVLTARTGETALTLIREARPKLVFMSCRMREESGNHYLDRIRADESLRETPVVMVMTSRDLEEAQRYLSMGCADTLCKPVSRKAFFDVVNRFIDLQKRVAPRFRDRFQVNYGFSLPPDLTGNSCNLSTGGLFMETNDPYPVGTYLNINFMLPDSDHAVNCRARVSWINRPEHLSRVDLPPGLGLGFVDLNPGDLSAIRNYLMIEHVSKRLDIINQKQS
jgi:CheY-like chemotaxis protein